LQEVLDLPVLWELLEVLVLRELREPRVPLVLLANKVSPAMWELQVNIMRISYDSAKLLYQ
jgi:hypothetical protein